MIALTKSAVDQVKHIIEKNADNAGKALRVRVTGGGCSGLSYKLDFDDIIAENDKQFEEGGVKVVVDPKSYLYLKGMTLDYSGGLNGKGFTFSNPNATKSCGCGSSFAV